MIRPYIAVLKDSLREAMASRVLWIAIIGIVVVLLGLAPFSLDLNKATQLRRRELVDAERFIKQLYENRESAGTPAAQLWLMLSKEQQTRFTERVNGDRDDRGARRPRRGGFNNVQRETVDALNVVLGKPDFHDADSFQSVELGEEAGTLIADGNLSPHDISRRNLLLLAAAFPKAIRLLDDSALSLSYAGQVLVEQLPIRPDELDFVVDEILIYVVALFLGFFGVFASLLVTAGIMPRTFEPGEISLLLSKPVSRPLLFLTKFLGGCAFTLLCAFTLVGGIWLLLGTRMGIWKHELLYCIPVYVFLFAMYYSVSAVAGVIWRNAIVALALVVAFWLGLTVMEAVKAGIQEGVINDQRIIEITPAKDSVIVVNSSRTVSRWDSATESWDELFQSGNVSGPGFALRLMYSGFRFRPQYDEASPDGSSHTVLTHDHTLWLADTRTLQDARLIDWRPPEDGETTAVAYDNDGHLMVTNGRLAVRSYDVETGQRVNDFAASEHWMFQVYDYVITPLHTILPKPSELDNFVRYLLTGKTSVAANRGEPDGRSGRRELLEERVTFDVWTPLLSNIGFLAVVLSIGCLYVSRRDF